MNTVENAAQALDNGLARDKAVTALAKLREPFPREQILQRPQPLKSGTTPEHCNICGSRHGMPAIHLDYVGHAELTARLLDVDPFWTWEPMGTDPQTGLPVLDKNGGLWIRLTVCGVTRPGYGDAPGQGGNAVKEAIGDALRNAAMRFGAALDLWSKSDAHAKRNGNGQNGAGKAPDAALVALKAQLWSAAQAAGFNGSSIQQRFTEWSSGGKLDEADEGLLREFLDMLKAAKA